LTTLFLDIETLPRGATVGMDLTQPPGWVAATYHDPPPAHPTPPPAHYVKADARQKWVLRQAEKMTAYLAREPERRAAHEQRQATEAVSWFRQRALNPLTMRIACVGYAIDAEPPEVLSEPEDEQALMLRLHELLVQRRPQRIVAHNGHRFDFPALQVAAVRGSWSPDPPLRPRREPQLARWFFQDKPWDTRLFDTCMKWPTTGRGGGSLDAICEGMGIPRNDNPISGAAVLDHYVAGDWGAVLDHCAADVRALREVYRLLCAMIGEEP